MPTQPLQIVIAGGTGQLGLILARHFHERGHLVTVISRYPKPREWQTVHWSGYDLGPWTETLDGADIVINLAGHTVRSRYNARRRREIIQSRVLTTTLIGNAIAHSSRPARVWLNASTAAIYRHSLDRPMDDIDGELGGREPAVPAAWRFGAAVAVDWEHAFFSAPTPRTRKVAFRSAAVMSPDSGGVFDTLLRLVRFGLGGAFGSGRQYVSWIHDVDFVRAIEFLVVREDLEGPFNLAAPNPVPNREFMCCLRRAWCTSYIGIPLPEWLLAVGAFLLRTEAGLVLKSRRAVPRRLLNAGFEFHFPGWRAASQDLVTRWRSARLE